MPRAVIFDWDGTLLLTRETVVCTLEKVLAEYGLPKWRVTKEKRDEKKSLADNFEAFFGLNHGNAYKRYLSLYLDELQINKFTKPSKVDELLDLFIREKIPLAIASNKERILLSSELYQAFPAISFQSIVCGGEAQNNKPHKDHVLKALEDIIHPDDIDDDVWLIGDSQIDIDCANNVGCTPVLIGNGFLCSETPPSYMLRYETIAELYSSLLEKCSAKVSRQ